MKKKPERADISLKKKTCVRAENEINNMVKQIQVYGGCLGAVRRRKS